MCALLVKLSNDTMVFVSVTVYFCVQPTTIRAGFVPSKAARHAFAKLVEQKILCQSNLELTAFYKVRRKLLVLLGSHECSTANLLPLQGLAKALPVELFALFTPEELDAMVAGPPFIDLDVLESATVYKGGLTRDTDCVR